MKINLHKLGVGIEKSIQHLSHRAGRPGTVLHFTTPKEPKSLTYITVSSFLVLNTEL